tara:strand:- start:448 stop:795 length:348 start_codon:yes stop_codon:yes gene_type:complete
MQDLMVRLLLAAMFVVSAFKGLTGGIGGATGYIKSKGLPMPAVLAVAGLVAKIFGSYSLITGQYEEYGLPILMLFVIVILVVFNNPFTDSSNMWMALALLGVLGGILSVYNKRKD